MSVISKLKDRQNNGFHLKERSAEEKTEDIISFVGKNLEEWCRDAMRMSNNNKKNINKEYYTVKIRKNLPYGISVDGGEKVGIYKYGIIHKKIEYINEYYYLQIYFDCTKVDSFGKIQCYTSEEYENLKYKLTNSLNDDKWGFKEVVIQEYSRYKKYEPVYDSIHTWKEVGKKYLYDYTPMVIKLKF